MNFLGFIRRHDRHTDGNTNSPIAERSSSGYYDDNRDGLLANDFLSTMNNNFNENRVPLPLSSSSDNMTARLGNDEKSKKNSRGRILSSKLMNFLGNLLAVLMTLSFLIIVPWVTANAMIYDKARPDFVAFYSAGAFVLVTVAMSTKLIYNHLTNWYMPDVQKYVVRILWMVPIYSIQSLLSLRFHNARLYIDTLRDLYEAYVIQSFLYYLMELLGGEDTLVQILQEKDDHYGYHTPCPNWLFPSWEMGVEFMLQSKHGVLQYVIAKIIATLATAILEPMGLFHDGEINFFSAYVYISFIINLSQMWALYCLVKFYHATSENLRRPVNWHPMGKFLCIKGVVFFTWWQGVLIVMLKNRGLIQNYGKWDKDDVANGFQDYLICVEMFCFAIAHAFTFTHEEYLPNRAGSSGAGVVSSSGDYQGRRNPYEYGHGPDEDDDDDDFGPPIIRTLDTPMGFRDAFWSSTVPNETFDDIRRTMRNGVNDQISNQNTEMGVLRNVSMIHAESI
mmetsp:Transcript_31512/g.36233  ORF Transcript_31512/g.36233 Transcript_31512/m.36233 type:complete len:506 (+) Transcript_31512:125-1642(+)